MNKRLAISFGAVILLAGCAAYPDYGYRYGYAENHYCGWGCYPDAYDSGPSFSLNFASGDRGDHDRARRDEQRRDEARAGAGGARHDAQVGRGGPQLRHEGGDHEHDR